MGCGASKGGAGPETPRGGPRVLGVIPARYGSTRFPGKPLAEIGGRPMVYHTYTNAAAAKTLTRCVVATDDERIKQAVEAFGGTAVMTSESCNNGTERCLEVLRHFEAKGERFDVVVNIQGDEPFIEPHHVDAVAAVVAKGDAVMGTLCRPHLDEADVTSVNNVKVVLDVNGYALYFSRAIIPHNKKGRYDPNTKYWRKLGIYSYTTEFLPKFIEMPASLLQDAEDLEQNKVIEAGYRIKVGVVHEAVHGVDTPEQMEHLCELYAAGKLPQQQVATQACTS